jgi:hypothetical protein
VARRLVLDLPAEIDAAEAGGGALVRRREEPAGSFIAAAGTAGALLSDLQVPLLVLTKSKAILAYSIMRSSISTA